MRLFLLVFLVSSLFASKPELLLLNKYNEDINVTSWYMSEKLDGVRAFWDGKKLISRSGKVFNAPEFFIKDFPKYKLDGELWTARADFSNVVSIVNQKKPHGKWKEITYNIFEVPNTSGNLKERLKKVKETKYIKLIKQIKVKNKKHLNQFQKSIEKLGGEGIVVRDGTLPYYTGRDNNALKVKSYIDEECEVVGYNNGNGKYKGMIGSLSCRLKNLKVIKIGSGLSDKQRAVPPKIGAIITFKYYGLTTKGNPRFPIFLRVRK
ncbi:MAG: DNA ligase [Sulfurimonas sp.]|nr:DNA ligase [Sulfurimonas sp.]